MTTYTYTTTTIAMSYAATTMNSKDLYWYLPWKPPASMGANKRHDGDSLFASIARVDGVGREPEKRLPSLPLELLLLAAEHLVPSAQHKVEDFQPDSSAGPSCTQEDHANFSTVLRLSSINTAMRRLLAPLIWQDMTIRRPDRLGKLRTLMDYYQRLASSASEIGRMVYPLPLVRSLRILMPDQYQSLDQEILRHLIRSGINPSHSLRTLEWDAEMLPGPMVWRMVGATEKMEGLEEILAERKERTLSREQIREIAYSGSATALYQPRDGRTLQSGSAIRAMSISPSSRSAGSSRSSSRSRSRSPPVDQPPGLQSLSISCRIFYAGNIDMSRLRSLRHLRLTSYDSHLLPSHLPSILVSLYRPLESISMSTSKTSLLHDVDLIQRGCFRRLKSLDLYAVTPEWPLCEGLRSAGKTLKHLRLILDVSGSFSNFDNLFKALTRPHGESHSEACPSVVEDQEDVGDNDDVCPSCNDCSSSTLGALPHLESLTIDPFPQQNTAPSFTRFLQSCPKLKLLNGRRLDLLPPGLEMWDFTPERRSGALFY